MLILIGLVLASMAIVREKEIGTIEQVMVTPIRRVEFILGKTLPFLLTGMVTMTMMFIIARILFGIRIQGSLPCCTPPPAFISWETWGWPCWSASRPGPSSRPC
jgi:ABC-type multidrug transport system permease subunit